MLPKNRGKHPLTWAIFLNLNETGSTFFKLDNRIDGGKIINQKKIRILKIKLLGNYIKKLKKIIITQINEIIISIENNNLKFENQNLSTGNYWRKRAI